MELRPSRGSPIFRATAFLVFFFTATRASGQTDADKKQAQALQVAGVHLMERGDNHGALEKFEEAFRLFPSPKILFNMGKAHHALGQEVEAVTALERFLDEAPYAPKESRAEAERVVESLRPKLSYLEIETDDSDCHVSIDGRDVGVSPLARAVPVTPGAHEVRLEKTGMNAETRTVSPVPGQKLRVFAKLSPPPAPAPIAPPRAATAAADVPAVAAPTPKPALASSDLTTSSPAPVGRPWQLTAAWISAGAGVLFLAGGVTAQILSSSKNADFNGVTNAPQSKDGRCTTAAPNDGGGVCPGLLDAAKTRQTLAIIGYVASGVALTGSLVFYLESPSSPTVGHDAALACLPSADVRSLSCALTARF